MSGPTDPVTDPPLPYDDSAVYEGRRLILNRIDQEWPCNVIIAISYGGPFNEREKEYCDMPEHDPFTEKCWYHGPGSPI
jgi:hypothetical protein